MRMFYLIRFITLGWIATHIGDLSKISLWALTVAISKIIQLLTAFFSNTTPRLEVICAKLMLRLCSILIKGKNKFIMEWKLKFIVAYRIPTLKLSSPCLVLIPDYRSSSKGSQNYIKFSVCSMTFVVFLLTAAFNF